MEHDSHLTLLTNEYFLPMISFVLWIQYEEIGKGGVRHIELTLFITAFAKLAW